MTALTPVAAVALAVRLLEAQGFLVSARNERGDSIYLSLPGSPFALRVSNHARTPKQRKNHREVLTSLVIREPKTAALVEAMVAGAVRVFCTERDRRIPVAAEG